MVNALRLVPAVRTLLAYPLLRPNTVGRVHIVEFQGELMKIKLIAIAAIALSPAVVLGQARTHIRVSKDGSHATSTGDVTTTPSTTTTPSSSTTTDSASMSTPSSSTTTTTTPS